MMLHFTSSEFAARKDQLLADLAERQLDGLLMFQQESMFWLTGYDTFGFCFFQSLWLGADGQMALLARSADLRQAQRTSTIQDIRIWHDRAGANPAIDLRDMLASINACHGRIGVEFESYGLVAANGRRLDAAFENHAILIDASDLVTRRRAVKSAAEIDYVRQAATLCDAARSAALDEIEPGADEGVILARMHDAIFRGGGDYPANEFIIGSAGDALLCRYKSGRRTLSPVDQITLEFAGSFRHYHAAMMETVCVGEATPTHQRYFEGAAAALAACADTLRPGRTAGDVFAAHARTLDEAGLGKHRLAACGYSLGAKFTPSWMDWPMFFEANDWLIEPGMVMFLHMILMDSATETAMCLGRTYLVTASGNEMLSGCAPSLVVR